MPKISILGIDVDFPKDPYPCQIDYMRKVIEALETNQNALLESPTGTGKTLCLLCATLAWQKARNQTTTVPGQVEIHKSTTSNRKFAISGGNSQPQTNRSVIIYATRTHSQLAQVVDELRDTSYRPKMTVLGSRDQLCIHEKISKLKGSLLNHSCSSLNTRRGCMYKNNLDGFISGSSDSSEVDILDIEDLTKLGQKQKICPYYFARDFSASSEIVFMPYNYLLDPSIRKTIRIAWDNAIIIFDEAHNLERVASDAASFTITSSDIAACIQELKQVATSLKEELTLKSLQKQSEEEKDKGQVSFTAQEGGSNGVQKPELAATAQLLKAMFELESKFDQVQLYPADHDLPPCSTLPGSWMVDTFNQAGLSTELLLKEAQKCSNYLMDVAEDALSGADEVLGGGSAPAHATEPKLNVFIQAFERVLRSKSGQVTSDYKVYISEEPIKKSNKISITMHQMNQKRRIINFWCFSTGVALTELALLNIKSFLLTSGTLSPLETLKEDLKLPFPIELQNPHVIQNDQIFVAAIAKGVTGKQLSSAFDRRNLIEYKDELAETILSISKKMLEADRTRPTVSNPSQKRSIAKGGILVFFSSYAVMESTVERWKFTNMYDRLKETIGYVILEPKGGQSAKKNDQLSSSKDWKSATEKKQPPRTSSFMIGTSDNDGTNHHGSKDSDEEAFNGIISEFDNAISRIGSCLLLAVCRGKVSEGIDFSNNKGRVVIVTGIPYAPFQDPWVNLKKQYLDEKTQRLVSSTAPSHSHPPQTVTNSSSIIEQRNNKNNNSNPWLKVQAPTLTTPAVYPPPPSSNYISAQQTVPRLSSAVTATNNKSSAPRLTGQMWYNQSASRAVNQCLGRVIRHCHDWGAIFLLDERFLWDRQVAELSKWMRPVLKKYSICADALKSYSSFLTTVTMNPKLYYEPRALPPPLPSTSSLIKRVVSQANQKRMVQDSFGRTIEISESQLPEGDDALIDGESTYIRRELLVSQQQTTTGGGLEGIEDYQDFISARQRLKPSSQSSLSNRSMNGSSSETAETPSMTLQSIIGKLKSKGSSSERNQAATDVASKQSQEVTVIEIDESSNLSRKKEVNLIDDVNDEEDGPFSLSFSQPGSRFPSSSSHSQPNLNPTAIKSESVQKFGLASATQMLFSSEDSIPFSISQQSTADTTITANKAAPSLFTLTQTLQMKQENRALASNSVPLPEIKAVFAKLQSYCQEGQIQEIKLLLSKTKEKKIQFVSQIKEFQSSLVSILTRKRSTDQKELSLERIQEILRLFVIIIPRTAPVITSGSQKPIGLLNSSQQEEKTYEFLKEFYLKAIDQQIAHLVYLRKTDPLSTSSSSKTLTAAAPSSAPSSSAFFSTSNTKIGEKLAPRSTNPLLDSSSSSSALNPMKRKYVNLIGTEELTENLGSHRAKRLLQLNNLASQSTSAQSQSSTDILQKIKLEPSAGIGKTTKDLFERIKDFSSFQVVPAASDKAAKGNTDVSLTASAVNNRRLQCCICKEIATVPCASKCGHICCQSCWMEWLAIKSICPMCREEVKKELITKIIIKPKAM